MDYSALADEFFAKTAEMAKSSMFPKKMNNFIHGEMFILNYLVDKGADALPSELSAAMKATSARVAMALKNLEKKGLVERRVNPRDRRKIIVSLTPAGMELIKGERAEMHRNMERILTELGEHDAREYIRIVGRIAEISRKMFGERK